MLHCKRPVNIEEHFLTSPQQAFDAYAIYEAAHKRLNEGKADTKDTPIVHLWTRIVQVTEQNNALTKELTALKRDKFIEAFDGNSLQVAQAAHWESSHVVPWQHFLKNEKAS